MQGIINFVSPLKLLLLLSILGTFVLALDLDYSDITVVNDNTRYRVTHQGDLYEPFKKTRYVKGNFVFSLGERISGDRLLVTSMDETQYTKMVDIEVLLRYPSERTGLSSSTLTYIEIYSNLSSDDADAYLLDGGIDKKFAKILLTCNNTLNYSYQTFFYGF